MGKNNTIVKRWLSNTKRTADLFNAEVFGGRQIIRPEELQLIPGESNIIMKDKESKEKNVERYRDIVMRWNHGLDFMILAIENQDKTHYAMPVRNMVYDGLAYTEQIKKIWEKYREQKNEVEGKEYLSRLKKDDRLNPIITIIFYYGEEPWDGKIDIHGLLGLDETEELDEIKRFIPNYHINLVEAARISNIDNYKSDLQNVFKMIQYKQDREKLLRYISENKDYFGKLDDDSYRMIKLLLKSDKLFEQVEEKEQEGERNMCKALEDLYAEGIEQGIEQGIKQGIEQGKREIILRNYSNGMQDSTIAQFLDMTTAAVRQIIQEGMPEL